MVDQKDVNKARVIENECLVHAMQGLYKAVPYGGPQQKAEVEQAREIARSAYAGVVMGKCLDAGGVEQYVHGLTTQNQQGAALTQKQK